MFLKDIVSVDRVLAGVVAGTSDQTSAAVDMAADGGSDEVTFLSLFGALTATQVTKIKAVQQSDDDGVADAYSDLEGTASAALADADSDKMLAITVRPSKRYVKLVIDRGTANAVIDGVVAIRSRLRKIPAVQSADVVAWECHDLPAEGTA